MKEAGIKQPLEARLNAAESFAGVLVGVVAADGVVTHREALDVLQAMERTSLFKGLSEKQLTRMFQRLSSLAREKGPIGLLEACAAGVPHDMREAAYAWAWDIALADDEEAPQETEYLAKAKTLLSIGDSQAARIHEVMRIKNQG